MKNNLRLSSISIRAQLKSHTQEEEVVVEEKEKEENEEEESI